ncbi:MAG: sensor histidine kinase [Lachnospiraceae bacterium]|nr:sensor histidine kinase [Lachnospiraceae bacterium]
MRLETYLRSFSVRTRLLAALLFVSIIPAVSIGAYAYNTYLHSITEKLTDSYIHAINQMNVSLTLELERYKNFLDDVSVSEEVQELMNENRGGAPLRRAVDAIIPDKSGYFRALRVIDRNGQLLYDTGFAGIYTMSEHQNLLKVTEDASPQVSLSNVSASSTGSLVIGRKIYLFPSGFEHIGYIFVFFSNTLLNRNILNDNSLGDGKVVLLSEDGIVLAGNTRNPVAYFEQDLFQRMLESNKAGEKSFLVDIDGVRSLIVFSHNINYSSYLVAIIPMSFINEAAAQTGRNLSLSVALAAIVSVALSLIIYQSVNGPIHNIIHKIQAKDKSKKDSLPDESADEIGFLARTIDLYTSDLEEMTKMRIIDQRRKRELELEALQYQINPHFVFNTLNSLRWVAVMGNAPIQVSDGLKSLSQLMRSVLLNNDEMVSLREELANLSHYFIIQKIRYADCFEVINEVDETVMESLIPRFILQPLAENAVLHGTEGGTVNIKITLRCVRTAGGVLMEIIDNGRGFDPLKIKDLSAGRFSGIGLNNVNERLKLYFGDNHGLEIISSQGEGTTCRVFVPGKGESDV